MRQEMNCVTHLDRHTNTENTSLRAELLLETTFDSLLLVLKEVQVELLRV